MRVTTLLRCKFVNKLPPTKKKSTLFSTLILISLAQAVQSFILSGSINTAKDLRPFCFRSIKTSYNFFFIIRASFRQGFRQLLFDNSDQKQCNLLLNHFGNTRRRFYWGYSILFLMKVMLHFPFLPLRTQSFYYLVSYPYCAAYNKECFPP